MKYLLLFCTVLCLRFSAFGQAPAPCGTEVFLQTQFVRNPKAKAHFTEVQEAIEVETKRLLAKPAQERGQIITIPVVIHVLFKGTIENISDAQIFSQLQILNEDYRRQNADRQNTPIDFQAVTADMEIEFCLAKRDPNGNPTSGITRTQTNYDNLGSLVSSDGRPRVYYKSLGGEDAWDPERYLNIWVAKIGSGILGVGSFPGSTPKKEDGVLVDPRYFGNTGWALLGAPHDRGRTCTHEVGHFLNLKHIWGDKEDSCDEDDGVGDTPTQRGPYLGCPAFPQLSCGNRAMYMNYMDYTDDSCQNLFTQGQKARVWATLATARAGLLTQTSLCTVSNEEIPQEPAALQVYPNPTHGDLFLAWKDDAFYTGSASVFSMDGKLLSTQIVENGRLSTENLSNGFYYISLSSLDSVFFARFLLLK